MTDTLTNNEPKSKTPEEAIEWLGLRADRLQQISSNIRQAVAEGVITPEKAMAGLGVTLNNLGSDRFNLSRNGQAYDAIHPRTPHCPVDSERMVREAGEARAVLEIESLTHALNEAAILVHKVQLDHGHLSPTEADILKQLPKTIEITGHMLNHVAQPNITPAEPENKVLVQQLKRDANELAKYGADITNTGAVLVGHNKKITDRQAALETEVDIDKDKATRFQTGVSLLTRSDEFAHERDPSYRNRVAVRRDPANALPVVTHAEVEEDRRKAAAKAKTELV